MQKLHYALIRDKFRKAGAALTIQNFFRETIRSSILLVKPNFNVHMHHSNHYHAVLISAGRKRV